MEKTVLITQIRDYSLCSGCGACYAICPNNAIKMNLSIEGAYRPFIESSKCTKCGLCEKACPTLSSNKGAATGLGNIIHCYTGYSADKNMRWIGSSGGIATSMICSLIKERTICGAVILQDNPKNPLSPLMTFVGTEKEVKSAVGSRYCPVKPCFKVKDLIKGERKIAVVGLPCHIWAFRNLEEIDPDLKSKILIHVGLLCGKCPNVYATTYFLRMSGVREKHVTKISYRGRGWPGTIRIETNQGSKRVFDLGQLSDWCRFSYFPHFIPVRCAICYDVSNQMADISLGDAWGLTRDQVGTSVIITRTNSGEQVINHLHNEGRIILHEVSPKQVSNGQGLEVKVKSSLIRAYFWQKIFKQPIPLTEFTFNRLSIKDWIFNLQYCTLLYLSKNSFMRAIMCNLTQYLSKLSKR